VWRELLEEVADEAGHLFLSDTALVKHFKTFE
jgi:hypothetical protein